MPNRTRTSFVIVALALSLIFTLSETAQAKITIYPNEGTLSAMDGFSNTTNTTTTTDPTSTVQTIYGGVAGDMIGNNDGECGNKNNASTCNNCVAISGTGNDRLLACNNRRIYADLVLQVTISSDTVDAGYPVVVSGGTAPTTISSTASTVPVAKGAQVVVNVRWGDLCAALTSSTTATIGNDCIPSQAESTGTISFGISTANDQTLGTGDDYVTINFKIRKTVGQNGNTGSSIGLPCSDDSAIGICYFEINSGDEKAVIRKMKALNGFPNADGVQYRKVRALYETTIFSDITAASPHQDLDISGTDPSSLSVSPSRVTGLKNETKYYFKLAVMDVANNVGYYTDMNHDQTTTDCGDISPTTADCHIAIPSEVVGILSNQTNCFIATAAFGSKMAPQVNIFRHFRDQYLIPNKWGKKFVRSYYEHSPKYAAIIAESETLRFISRLALYPLLAYAALALQIGAPWATALVVLLLGALVYAGIRLRKRSRQNMSQKIRRSLRA